eukprot:s2035_g1.t1
MGFTQGPGSGRNLQKHMGLEEMKRANESHGPPPKRGRGPAGLAGKCVFKVLCPDELVARILGSNGQAVAQIQDSSGLEKH